MRSLYPTDEQYLQYWKGQKRRADARSNREIDKITMEAKEKATNSVLEALNNRRYLSIDNPRKRLVAVRRDKKAIQVNEIIIDAGRKSIDEIRESVNPHYEEEVPMVAEKLYPWTLGIGNIDAGDLTEMEVARMMQQPYLGRTYREWIDINTKNAVRQWTSSFRSIMTGEIQEVGKVQRGVQALSSIRSVLDAQGIRNKTIFTNSMIQVSRQAQADVTNAIWPNTVNTGAFA